MFVQSRHNSDLRNICPEKLYYHYKGKRGKVIHLVTETFVQSTENKTSTTVAEVNYSTRAKSRTQSPQLFGQRVVAGSDRGNGLLP